MKLVLALVATVFSVQAIAQTGISSAIAEEMAADKSKGFTAGVVYTAIDTSDVTASMKFKAFGQEFNSSSTAKQDIYTRLIGLNLGYKNNYAFTNFGYSTSATLFKGMNTEFPTDAAIYKVQGDLIYPMNSTFNLSAGINASYFAQRDENVTVTPGLGGQLGIQMDVGNTGFLLGYQSMAYSGKYSSANAEIDLTHRMRGIVAQMAYTF